MAILADNGGCRHRRGYPRRFSSGCLLDHMGRQVAEITAALSRSMLRGRARRPCASTAGAGGRLTDARPEVAAGFHRPVGTPPPKLMTEAK